MVSDTIVAAVFLAVGILALATMFMSNKKSGKPPGRRSKAFKLVFGLVLVATGVLMFLPEQRSVLDVLHFPTLEGLKKAGFDPVGATSMALPAFSALAYAVCAFAVFGEKKKVRKS